MAGRERQVTFNEFLDEEKKNLLIVRFILSADGLEVEEFAVCYIAIVDEKPLEIVRYDCSKKEAINLHHFCYKPELKRYLDKEKNLETVDEFVEDIKRNWIKYRLRFFEKRGLF